MTEKCEQDLSLFQFHKGTIKTRIILEVMSSFKWYFNSIKVRLKQSAYINVEHSV